MNFRRRSILVLFVAFAALSACGPLHSQYLPIADGSLPDEPRPQVHGQSTPSETGRLFAENYSSSALPYPVEELQTTAPPQAQVPAEQPDRPLTGAEKRKAAEEELQRELHQRLGGIVPNFNAVIDGSNVPLTPGQKMRASFRSAIDPYQFGLAFITSGYGQATDSHSSIDPNGTHHGYSQGWGGFGERYGANFVDQFNGTIIGNGILPALLHQDARYFRMGTGSFKTRFFYSLGTTLRCKSDKGNWQPNYSNVVGNIISGGISNLYYPKADRGFELTLEQGFQVTAEGSIGALLIEFYPDIRRHFSKHPSN